MQYLISAMMFSGFNALVEELQGEPATLLVKFGLPIDIESKPERHVPFSSVARLLEHCAEALACPDFGLKLSQRQGLSILGPVAVLARNAATVDQAVRSIGDYLHLISPAMAVGFEMKLAERCIRASFSLVESGLLPTRQMYELYVGNGQLIVQMLIGSEVFADKMYFTHRRVAPEKVYKDLFRCDVEFAQEFCAVDLPIAMMQRKLIQADQETARIASNYLAEHYGGKSSSLHEQTLHLIHRLLPTGYCKINIISEQLGLHPRTLQRRLAEENVVFEKLVDEQRRVLAQRYLAESNLRLTQVTGLLGYGDQSALNRSCKRWFKQTPKQIRARLR